MLSTSCGIRLNRVKRLIQLIKVLNEGPTNTKILVQQTGFKEDTVRLWLKQFHRSNLIKRCDAPVFAPSKGHGLRWYVWHNKTVESVDISLQQAMNAMTRSNSIYKEM